MTEDSVTIRKSTFKMLIVVFVAVLLAASFLAGYSIGSSNRITGAAIVPAGTPTSAATGPNNQPPESPVKVSLDDDPVKGNSDAKVTIIEFSDFQCPFCSRFFEQTLPQLDSDYIKTGKAKFAYRDFPLESIHPQAVSAALAANCANEQGKFWDYHDKIFKNQQSLGLDSYKQWAAELSLDSTKFNSCLDSQKYVSEVQKDVQDGINSGVSGTPTFFIGNDITGYQKIVGAQPYVVLKQAIDKTLNS